MTVCVQIARVRVLSNSEDQKTWLVKSEDHNAVWLQTQRRCFDFIGSRQGLTDGVDAEVGTGVSNKAPAVSVHLLLL